MKLKIGEYAKVRKYKKSDYDPFESNNTEKFSERFGEIIEVIGKNVWICIDGRSRIFPKEAVEYFPMCSVAKAMRGSKV